MRCKVCVPQFSRADREEAIADWLAAHEFDTASAEALADTQVTFEALDQLAETVHGSALDAVLHWAAAGMRSSRPGGGDFRTRRCESLVWCPAIKGFTHHGSGDGGRRAGGTWT